MKAKKYTNSSWTEGDYEKEYSTATDTYTTLPATFQTSGADVVNYQVYGTPDGVGEETENLFDYTAKDTSKGYVSGSILLSSGTVTQANGFYVSEYIPISGSQIYAFYLKAGYETASLCFYDASKNYADGEAYNFRTEIATTSPSNAAYVRFSVREVVEADLMLTKGSTAPASYIPPGYKIPILNTSGVTENFYDDETSSDKKLLDGLGNLSNNSYYKTSDYIDCTGGSKINCYGVSVFDINRLVRIAFYDNYQAFLSEMDSEIFISGNYSLTFTAPQNARYFRFSFIRTDTDVSATLRYTSNYDLFLGDSKLYEDEYLDYQTQKVYKLKEVHEDTVTIDGVVWDILGYDHDEVYDGEGNLASHSVTIQTHDCIANLQFDSAEALFAFPNGATAGTYHFTVTEQPHYSGDVGKTMQFTLLNDIPPDGVIVLGNAHNATMIGSTISVFASPSATMTSETATISEGSDGTDLGSVGNAILGNTNSIQRALVGNNNYNQSAIRQYLNSDGTVGTYWTPQNKWDRPPIWNGSQVGFLNGYNTNFKNAIGTSKKVTLSSSFDGGGTETTNEKVFLLSSTEVYCGGSEGTAYSYYSDYSDLSDAGTGTDSNRIKQISNTAKYWWLRSCDPSYARSSRVISLNGSLGSYGVVNPNAVAPAVCIPLDNINNDPYLQSLFLKPVDPPAPFPTISTYLGENNLSVDTTTVPDKVMLTVAAWRKIEAKKYVNEEWSDNNDT